MQQLQMYGKMHVGESYAWIRLIASKKKKLQMKEQNHFGCRLWVRITQWIIINLSQLKKGFLCLEKMERLKNLYFSGGQVHIKLMRMENLYIIVLWQLSLILTNGKIQSLNSWATIYCDRMTSYKDTPLNNKLISNRLQINKIDLLIRQGK